MKILANSFVEQVNLGIEPLPADWVSRRLYAGEERARSFLDVLRDPSYKAPGLKELCRFAVAQVHAQTMVSFGPGDGRFDAELVQILKQNVGEVTYIPVDISRVLLETAGAEVGRVVPVPVGLLLDIEHAGSLLRDTIDGYSSRPVLFSMLGGTLANLDSGETQFFKMLSELMHPGDSFLVDLPLYGPAWKAENDPRLNSREYTNRFKRFLAGGILSREHSLALEEVGDWFDKRVVCLTREVVEIKHSKLFEVIDQRTGDELVSTRLYDWQSVKDWLSAVGFEILIAQSTLLSAEAELAMGVVVVRKAAEVDPRVSP